MVKEFSCYNANIAVYVKNDHNAIKNVLTVEKQCFPALEKILIIKTYKIPDWFNRFPGWQYKINPKALNNNLKSDYYIVCNGGWNAKTLLNFAERLQKKQQKKQYKINNEIYRRINDN